MIEEAQDFIPIWMLLSAAFGFLIGESFGDSSRHRKCLEQINDDLRDQIEKAEEKVQRELNRQRAVINDIHKRMTAVTKGLQKRSS